MMRATLPVLMAITLVIAEAHGYGFHVDNRLRGWGYPRMPKIGEIHASKYISLTT